MLVLAIKWLLPLVAIGFLAGAMFRLRYQVVAALALAAACTYYFFKYKYAESVPALTMVLSIPLFIGGYGSGALFGRFVQSEVKGRPVMSTLSVLTVACLLFTSSTSSI